MFTNIHKFEFKRGFKSNLYDPRRTKYKEEDLKTNICNLKPNVAFLIKILESFVACLAFSNLCLAFSNFFLLVLL